MPPGKTSADPPRSTNETLRVEDLASLATMSASSFHRHFRAVTSMTPIQFQKQIRLHEARARLLAEPGDVTGVGFAVGYDSPSQFSREYRRMFGVPPKSRRDRTARGGCASVDLGTGGPECSNPRPGEESRRGE